VKSEDQPMASLAAAPPVAVICPLTSIRANNSALRPIKQACFHILLLDLTQGSSRIVLTFRMPLNVPYWLDTGLDMPCHLCMLRVTPRENTAFDEVISLSDF
jgi:hypothetical protein